VTETLALDSRHDKQGGKSAIVRGREQFDNIEYMAHRKESSGGVIPTISCFLLIIELFISCEKGDFELWVCRESIRDTPSQTSSFPSRAQPFASRPRRVG